MFFLSSFLLSITHISFDFCCISLLFLLLLPAFVAPLPFSVLYMMMKNFIQAINMKWLHVFVSFQHMFLSFSYPPIFSSLLVVFFTEKRTSSTQDVDDDENDDMLTTKKLF